MLGVLDTLDAAMDSLAGVSWATLGSAALLTALDRLETGQRRATAINYGVCGELGEREDLGAPPPQVIATRSASRCARRAAGCAITTSFRADQSDRATAAPGVAGHRRGLA